ncbi:nucleoside kinase [Prevotella sp. OH937_COT-195]|uniref:nucleoside kinase n=1 Tax=Prevotella sp. OH937_COT-195 TaxID=2491051 RepID=UPI000F6504CC|nr:nucleoside kinase [Prevotella sp. OH937_COT-195]RRC99499.1 nucleoside kinase [Prevotella sp. OH937_COT-195]
MKQTVKIRCKNNKKTVNAEIGSTLYDIFSISGIEMKHEPVSAKVNNKVEGMHYRVYHSQDVEFLDVTTPSGHRAYVRTLFFILCKAVHDIYPEGHVVIDIPVSNGYYCDLKIGRAVTQEDVKILRRRMEEMISSKMPIRRHECPTEEAVEVFSRISAHSSKVKLLRGLGSLYTVYYEIDGYYDYYYGTMLTNTRLIYLFGLEKYYDGLLLRIPSPYNPDVLGDMVRQDKMFEIFQEHHRWQNIIGLSTVGDFNEQVKQRSATEIINVSEALQEKKIAQMAEAVAEKKGVRMVLIAGPSSSGKTTTCKRLSIQLMTCGLRPVQISLDDYFVNRAETPLDEKGDYDYESLYALNIPLLNNHMERLFEGEEITLPQYDFQTGISNEQGGKKLRLRDNDILVVEGIHALNPKLTGQIPDEKKYRVYASALTTILLDDHNYIPTTDNRLLRRIIRDYKYRGCSAEDTIRRWASVRAGENKWIFPYQENADTMFNTAMLFELAVIRNQAEPILRQVPQNSPEHAEAYRLLKFLSYISPINDREIPPTSLIREFLGGSSFKY